MNKEQWLPISGYEGYYEISNTGKVRSLTRTIIRKNGHPQTIKGKEKILSLDPTTGYYKVILCKEGKGQTCYVHRLVAMNFIPNPNNLPCVNHKDENKTNNNIDNLEWCTPKENINWGTAQERHSQTRSTPILMCDKNTHKPIKEFLNARIAGEELNLSSTSYLNIYKVLYGQRKSAYGYWWTYKNNC